LAGPEEKARHDRIVALVERMLQLHQESSEPLPLEENENRLREIAATDAEIDSLVRDLYRLTAAKIRILEASGRTMDWQDDGAGYGTDILGLLAAELLRGFGTAKRRLDGHGEHRIRVGKRRTEASLSFYAFPVRATKKTATIMNNMATAILTGVRSVPGRY
jgi:hypothetical protein